VGSGVANAAGGEDLRTLEADPFPVKRTGTQTTRTPTANGAVGIGMTRGGDVNGQDQGEGEDRDNGGRPPHRCHRQERHTALDNGEKR
jgi:hypothetical protein